MKKNNKLVSIVMNCHNGQKFLDESVKSVLKQSYQNWELIFFNNFSKDKSEKMIKRFNDKRIKYFKSNIFLKLYNARNLAIKKCKGEYVCFLDTDDLWNKNKLQTQVNYIVKTNCEILYSKYTILNEINDTKYLNKKYNLPAGSVTQNFLNDYPLGILTVIIKKKIFQKIKFNKRYQIIGDFDFFIRASENYIIHVINKSLASYRHHSDNLSNKKRDLYLQEFKYWLKNNEKKLKNFNLLRIKFYIFKLFIKKIIFSVI